MSPIEWVLFPLAGILAGFVAGLLGLGGGLIFAPVLFFYYEAIGIPSEFIVPLTVGSSLLCILFNAVFGTWFRRGLGIIRPRTAIWVGLFSAFATYAMTELVTTKPWYDPRVFQIVFSILLILIAIRLLMARDEDGAMAQPEKERPALPLLGALGVGAGTVAVSAGVGGGIILVPAYNRLLRLPLKVASGTSGATVILVATSGVLNYILQGWDVALPIATVGFVDVTRALVLALPAVIGARLGVSTAQRVNTRVIRWSFAIIATLVVIRLLSEAFGG